MKNIQNLLTNPYGLVAILIVVLVGFFVGKKYGIGWGIGAGFGAIVLMSFIALSGMGIDWGNPFGKK